MSVIWHDVECGGYAEDLQLWRSLAEEHGDPILDVGAGTGRVTLELARSGYRVTALDRDPRLIAALEERLADNPEIVRDICQTVVADARDFELSERFRLAIVPMQTIQLLGGPDGRGAFLRCAHRHLVPDGVLAVAIAEVLDLYEVVDEMAMPLPDVREYDGTVYSSQPTAVRADQGGFVLERRRETVTASGDRTVEDNLIRLDSLSATGLQREGRAAGFRSATQTRVPETADYVGSEVVILHA
jgi:SAM-dependent methyltransferase